MKDSNDVRQDSEQDAQAPSPRRRFYFGQLVCFLIYWTFVRRRTGMPFYALATGTVCTRPRWMPSKALLFLARFQVPVFLSMPLLLACTAAKSDCLALRLATAAVTSLYHLLESSVTTRHGEYPLLYNVWAMVLPERYAQSIALGVVTNFITSSGVAKLQVGGASWMHPRTMRTYLDIYHGSQSNPPLSKRLNRWIAEKDLATRAIAVGTVALECVAIPCTLFMPARFRSLGSLGMVGLHFGIALAMSGQVGMAFVTSLPSYLLGFSCSQTPFGSTPWLLATVLGLGPSLGCMLCGYGLPEEWPLTPVSLFMWSGDHADRLRRSLMGATRVVLSTAAAPHDITGLPILYNGPIDLTKHADGGIAVHDALTRVIGFTLAQGDLVQGALAIHETSSSGGWDVSVFLDALARWLRRDRRMIEMRSGETLLRASFVSVDSAGRVGKVLADTLQVSR